jgi:acetylornithine/succinyldiaminopimelate/putrescine aminotransferase
MNMLWKAALMAGAVALSSFAAAEEATPVPTEAQAQEASGEAIANTVVNMTPTGDQVVTVNTGNETVDALANTAVKCAERSAAFKACDSMGRL